jgi:N-sulfoglucosamine sulfohydrolase
MTNHRSLPLAVASALLLAAWTTASAQPKPNIVVFLADDLGWADCSIDNPECKIPTPNMELVAKAGITFSHAFVASPSCAPSRAALLTGLTPARNGAMFNHQLPRANLKKWPAWFREAGYETAAIGKVAHYATVRSYGFDHVSHFTYHADECVNEAVKWLENRQAAKPTKPLCLMVGTNWPHVPWPQEVDAKLGEVPLPPTFVDTPETRTFRERYAQAVAFADRDLGLVYDAAFRLLGENTLFLFTSDHGAQFPFGKWNCYDAGIRTPLVAVWPGQIEPGSQSDALVSWLDLLPTCLDAAGIAVPARGDEGGKLSGWSLLELMRGKADAHREFIFTTHSGDGAMNEYPIRSVRSRNWKYIRNLAPQAEHHTHIDKALERDGGGYWTSWTQQAESDAAAAAVVSRYHRRPAEELYDLRSDPHEQRNLAADPAQAERLATLRGQLEAWMQAQGDAGLKTEDALRPPRPASKR